MASSNPWGTRDVPVLMSDRQYQYLTTTILDKFQHVHTRRGTHQEKCVLNTYGPWCEAQ